MANTFDWVEIRTRDIEKTADFYKNLFGWEVIRKETSEGSDYWIFDTGGKPRIQNLERGGICLIPDNENPGVLVYIAVEDIETVLKKVTESGGKVTVPRMPHGSAFKAYFTDPDGNSFGLWEEKNIDWCRFT